jgi:hypothetical protein
VDASRIGGEIGVDVLPLLIGNNILLRSRLSYLQYRYSGGGDTYRVPEIGVAASYIFDQRTQIGAALYRREPQGRTPFFFDQIDTRSEAQGLVQGRITNRVTAALLLRYDLEQARLFDYGVTVGIRGRSLEPRFGYRKLGGQFLTQFSPWSVYESGLQRLGINAEFTQFRVAPLSRGPLRVPLGLHGVTLGLRRIGSLALDFRPLALSERLLHLMLQCFPLLIQGSKRLTVRQIKFPWVLAVAAQSAPRGAG